jgi:hypothetical protein
LQAIKSGVSNTLPTNHMWPARCICATHFSCKLRAAKAFFHKLWPAEHFFFVMWPSDKFEFEAPAVNDVYILILKFSAVINRGSFYLDYNRLHYYIDPSLSVNLVILLILFGGLQGEKKLKNPCKS